MRRLVLVLILLAAALVAWPTSATAKTHEVISGVPTNTFTPSVLTIEVGDTVRWTNEAGNHNVVALDGTFYSGAPSSSTWQYEFRFTTAGTYDYVCAVHSQMTGRIIVVPADSTPSPTPTSPSPTATTPSPTPTSPSPTVTSTTTSPSPTVSPSSSSPTTAPTNTSGPGSGTTSPAPSPTTTATTNPTTSPIGGGAPDPTSRSSATPSPGTTTAAPSPDTTDDDATDGDTASSSTDPQILGEQEERPAGSRTDGATPSDAPPQAAAQSTGSGLLGWLLTILLISALAAGGGWWLWRHQQ